MSVNFRVVIKCRPISTYLLLGHCPFGKCPNNVVFENPSNIVLWVHRHAPTFSQLPDSANEPQVYQGTLTKYHAWEMHNQYCLITGGRRRRLFSLLLRQKSSSQQEQ